MKDYINRYLTEHQSDLLVTRRTISTGTGRQSRLQVYHDEQFTGSLKTVVGLIVLKNLSRRLDKEAAHDEILEAESKEQVLERLR